MHCAWASDDAGPIAEPELVDDEVDDEPVSCATPGCAELLLQADMTNAPHPMAVATTAERPNDTNCARLAGRVWGERRNISMLVFLLGGSVVLVVRQQR